jgi:hypothetical protein
MSIKRRMAGKFRTRKQNSLNATTAKHYEFHNGPAQTQALPRRKIRCARNGTAYEPDLLLVKIGATIVPTSTQKPLKVSEGDRLNAHIGKQ